MKDAISGIGGGGGWGLLAGAIIPAAIAVGIIGVGVFPYLSGAPIEDYLALRPTEKALVLGLLSIVLGFVIHALQTPLYRIVEGYLLWPDWLSDRRTRHHQARRIEQLGGEDSDSRVEQGLALERAGRYPAHADDVAPTLLGNALSALETYADDRYSMASQALWYELDAVAPAPLRTELERAQAPVDFCVNSFYLSGLLGVTLLITGVAHAGHHLELLVGAAVAFGLMPLWYGVAVMGVAEWQAIVRALVNLGRPLLAEAYGLRLPVALEEERDMWHSLSRFVMGICDDDDVGTLDRYRRAPSDT